MSILHYYPVLMVILYRLLPFFSSLYWLKDESLSCCYYLRFLRHPHHHSGVNGVRIATNRLSTELLAILLFDAFLHLFERFAAYVNRFKIVVSNEKDNS